MKPIEGSFPPYFANYIQLVSENQCMDALNNQRPIVMDFFDSLSAEKADYAYAPGKWTIKEMLQHMIDTERIFAYRALCVARKEQHSLLGFDENAYAANSRANHRTWDALLNEFKCVRETTSILFQSFEEDVYEYSGLSSNQPVTVNAIGFIIVGHVYHHINVLKERYLISS
jgi:uncharacterized damage-inducible protein DinB